MLWLPFENVDHTLSRLDVLSKELRLKPCNHQAGDAFLRISTRESA